MNTTTNHPFAQHLAQLPDSRLLYADQPTNQPTNRLIIQRKKLAQLPDLTAPEAVEWSKPLPPEQWAKRSPELERAIAEREAELAQAERAA